MALMFARLARNFAKNGYFPTDEATIERVLSFLAPSSGDMRIIDPCCGEGAALAEVKQSLGNLTRAYGIEYDAERALNAKQLLDRCIHGDFQNCVVGVRQFGLLWLNPPYGDLVADKADCSDAAGKGRKRLEKLFYTRSHGLLQFGGVMVLIIPHYVLDKEFANWIGSHFERVAVYRAAVDTFKQVVILGVKRRAAPASPKVMELLEAVGCGDVVPTVLPESWHGEPYVVPSSTSGELKMLLGTLEPSQLSEEVRRYPCLWPTFKRRFSNQLRNERRPLTSLSPWHLSLFLAAGQVSGVVRSDDGRTFVVRGDTFKEKSVKVEIELDDKGSARETRIMTDKFVPVIRALDFTEGPDYGRIVTIR
jgi:hypothetical protein